MDSSRDHFEQQQPGTSGPLHDVKRLSSNSAASAAELREFLGKLKGRSPQEVMGIVAQSSLFQGITSATIACAVLLLVCTIVPYAISDGSVAGPASTATVTVDAQPTNTVTPETPATKTPDVAATEPTNADLQRAADAMGIGESKEAAPNKNPLDVKLDNLLDGIE